MLLLSTAEAATRDPELVLWSIGRRLRVDGYEVAVRCHPREDRALLDEFPINVSASVAVGTRHVTAVIGYPGSALPVCATLGNPVEAVAPNERLRAALPSAHQAVFPMWATRADELELTTLVLSTKQGEELVCGPVGGAAQRLVELWTAS